MRDNHDQGIQRTIGKIKHTILEYRMLPEDGRIVIGVSGGADSMALAHFLSGLIHNKERILIAHINHGLRGTEALRDEQHVEAWCRENGLCFVVFHADVRQMSADTGKGEEECGREIRYSFFESLIKEENDRIATAHTRSDACETLLFHLAIGAGARGMAGIPPVRGRIIRPFIDITRKEVEQYCDYFRIPYVTDSSNASENYARNRLRIGIRPIFDTINPSWEQAIGRLMRSFMEDESCLVHYAKEALADAKMADGYCLNALSSLPQAVLLRAVRLAAEEAGAKRLTDRHLRACTDCIRSGRGGVSLPGDLLCRVEAKRLLFLPARKEKFSLEKHFVWPQTLTGDGRIVIIDMLCSSFLKKEEKQHKFHNLFLSDMFDCDIITQDIVLRTRREGDRFSPAGRRVTKTLRKLFQEAGVPASKRDSILLLENQGEIFWVEGFGVSDRCRVTAQTVSAGRVTVRCIED